MQGSQRIWQLFGLMLATASCGASGVRSQATTARSTTAHPSPSVQAAAIATDGHSLQGSTTFLSADEQLLLTLDEDNGNLVGHATSDRTERFRVHVGTQPVSAVALANGKVLITDRATGHVVTVQISPDHTSATVTARTRIAADTVGITVDGSQQTAYVTSGIGGTLTALDLRDMSTKFTVRLREREPRGIAIRPDGSQLYIGHNVGGQISVVDLDERHNVRTISLPRAPMQSIGARRPRNAAPLARSLVFGNDNAHLFVAHVAESTGEDLRPEERSGGYGSAEVAGTARPVVTVSVLDVRSGNWEPPKTNERCTLEGNTTLSDPTAIAFRPSDGKLVLTGQGTRALGILDPTRSDPATCGRILSLASCDGPSGIAVSRNGTTYVNCQFDHAIAVVPPQANASIARIEHIGDELPDAEVAQGRRLFHQADRREISGVGFSCATCHPDGREDGNVWSIENGVRQTPFLAGRMTGTAPFNWQGQSHSLEDNMVQTMQRLGGTGMGFGGRRALAAFLARGLRTPEVAPAEEAESLVARGRTVFEQSNCDSCHSGGMFTDNHVHNVSSSAPTEPSTAFDTPSLRFVGFTAPYFHDGRYNTLEAMISANNDRMGHTSNLSPQDVSALVAYLQTL